MKLMATLLFLSFGLIFVTGADASTALASTIWCNPANSGKEDGATKDTGYKTLGKSMSAMSPGDTVIIADGDWSKGFPDMALDNDHLPPSGNGYSQMTTVRSETDWGVKIPAIYHIDKRTGRNYVKIQGLVAWDNMSQLSGWKHSKIIRCGFFGKKISGNVITFALHKGIYNLIEECIAWGGGRYKFGDGGHHNIWRRCVARHDWYASPEWPGQESNFRGYSTHDSIWQNCISIDSDRVAYQETDSKEDGDFWIGDQGGGGGNIIAGCMVIKGMYQAFYLGGMKPADTVQIVNSLALGPSPEGMNGLTGALTYGVVTANVVNCLFYNFQRGYQHLISHNKDQGRLKMTDSIAVDVGKIVIVKDVKAFSNCYFRAGSGSFGTNAVAIDPFKSGLMYPTRLEPGSILATAGSEGGPCGPTVLKKIGVSGTCRDEKGWAKITEENLWPFPNEAIIRTLMRNTVDGVNGVYGFCEDGQTLTNYVWGYFGNTVPPFKVRAIPGDGKAEIVWDRPTETALSTIVGYNVYDVTGESRILMGATVSGGMNHKKTLNRLVNGRTYTFAVTAIDEKKGESGLSYEVRVTPGRSFEKKDAEIFAETKQSGITEQNAKLVPEKRVTNRLGMEFVYIPPGEFTMGMFSSEIGVGENAKLHRVNLTKGFYMQTTEVTQGQWKKVMGTNPSFFKACGEDCPVEQVSWNQVQQFIKRLNRVEGMGQYRLPSESEWEYACRAGSTTPFFFGPCLSVEKANHNGEHPLVGCEIGRYRKKPITVKTFPPNTWGLAAMHGNVWEWCQDRLGPYPVGAVTDPTGPSSGALRVIRGGGWNSYAKACASGNRSGNEPSRWFANLGFRLVKEHK